MSSRYLDCHFDEDVFESRSINLHFCVKLFQDETRERITRSPSATPAGARILSSARQTCSKTSKFQRIDQQICMVTI